MAVIVYGKQKDKVVRAVQRLSSSSSVIVICIKQLLELPRRL